MHAEFKRFVAWALVGAINTLIHLGVVIGLVEVWGTDTVLANAGAFLTANAFSFLANSFWVFRAQPTLATFTRFMLVSLIGLAISLLCSALTRAANAHYLLGVLLTLGLLPILTFASHRYWTWRNVSS